MRLRVSDLETALCAISIQNCAEVGSGLSAVALRAAAFSAPRGMIPRGGRAVSTDDENRLTPLRIEVKRKIATWASVWGRTVGPATLPVDIPIRGMQ